MPSHSGHAWDPRAPIDFVVISQRLGTNLSNHKDYAYETCEEMGIYALHAELRTNVAHNVVHHHTVEWLDLLLCAFRGQKREIEEVSSCAIGHNTRKVYLLSCCDSCRLGSKHYGKTGVRNTIRFRLAARVLPKAAAMAVKKRGSHYLESNCCQ